MSDSRQGGYTASQQEEPSTRYEAQNDISLFDLWAVIVRRRAILVLTTVSVIVLSGLYVFMVPAFYTYSTAIEVGSFFNRSNGDGGNYEPLEAPTSVSQRLELAIVPMVRREFEGQESEVPEVSVKSNQESRVVALASNAALTRGEEVAALHQRVVDLIVEAHEGILKTVVSDLEQVLNESQQQLNYLADPVVERSRNQPLEEALAESRRRLQALDTDHQARRLRLDNELAEARFKLEELRDEQKYLKGQTARLDREKALVKEQIARNQTTLDRLQSSQDQDAGEASESSEAVNQLVIASRLDQARSRLDTLQSQLEIELPRELDELANRVEENLRAQSRATNDINALTTELSKMDSDYKADLAEQKARIDTAKNQLEDESLKYGMAVEDARSQVRTAENNLSEVTPTSVVFVALRSLEPVGPGGTLVLVLGAILGGMLGIFSVFATEFVSRANQFLRDSE